MLCGKCRKQLLCKHCGEPEFSQEVSDDPDFRHDRYECRCERFREDECVECSKIIEYVGKDAMWYVRSFFEAVMILIFLICLIVFIAAWFVLIWNGKIANIMFGWSVCVGMVDILFLFSIDDGWRVFYEDHSMIFNIEEKRPE